MREWSIDTEWLLAILVVLFLYWKWTQRCAEETRQRQKSMQQMAMEKAKKDVIAETRPQRPWGSDGRGTNRNVATI